MKMKSESEVAQLCPTLSDPVDCSLPGSSVRGIFQARVLERGATAFSEYDPRHPQWCCGDTAAPKVAETSHLHLVRTQIYHCWLLSQLVKCQNYCGSTDTSLCQISLPNQLPQGQSPTSAKGRMESQISKLESSAELENHWLKEPCRGNTFN